MTSSEKAHGFTIEIHPNGVSFDEEAAHLPAHELVLRPILNAADSAFVFNAPTDSQAVREASTILTREDRRLRIAIDQEIILGFERLWNAGAGARGTIAVKSRINADRLDKLFSFCGSAWHWDSKSEIGVFGVRALRFAASEVAPGCRIFMLSRSNGIQWLGVYAVPEEAKELFASAQARCKPFKRWFEVSNPEHYNILGQYDKPQIEGLGVESNGRENADK